MSWNRLFRLQWPRRGRPEHRHPRFSIFVGNLAPDVTEHMLTVLFQLKYKSCGTAEIVFDRMSGFSCGYGFVRFHRRTDRDRAYSEMQGVYCGNRPMRIGLAKKYRAVNARPGMSTIVLWPCGWVFPWDANIIRQMRTDETDMLPRDVFRSGLEIRRDYPLPTFPTFIRISHPIPKIVPVCPICTHLRPVASPSTLQPVPQDRRTAH